ncbi:MAG: DUF1016 domain-containing protein [Symploca sp. SIO1C2]|nr:DUF1016 domain-containing protein [Symploca sp. SIO1C2]
MKEFSPRNLKYMRTFAEAYPDESIVQQLVAQILWGHNVRIFDTVKELTERLWYIHQTKEISFFSTYYSITLLQRLAKLP